MISVQIPAGCTSFETGHNKGKSQMTEQPIQPSAPNAGLTPEDAQAISMELSSAGASKETITEYLKAQGYSGSLELSPHQEASNQMARLKADPAFVERLNRGDAEANAELDKLCATLAGTPATEKPLEARDYKFNGYSVSQAVGDDKAEAFINDAAVWAAELQLRPEVASAIMDMGLAADAKTAGMDDDAFANHAAQEIAQLKSVLARHGDADKRIADAQAALKKTGADINILNAARHSAEIAMELVLHGEALAAGRR